MINQGAATNILQLVVILLGVGHSFAQGSNITFLPDVPRCIGEEVEMICYVIPPADTSFAVDSAFISLNRSLPVILNAFNAATSLGGVDTTRYTADTTGLTISTSRPGTRVTISDYQATDGSVLFGCAGLFSNSSESNILISDSPQSIATPPSPPVSLTAEYNSPTCSGTVQLAWTPGASDREIEMYFLSLNGVLIASLGPVTSYDHTTTLQRDTEYTYSVVAMSCAGSSTETPAPSISVGTPPSSPLVILSQTDTSCSNLLISWSTPSSDRSILTYSVYRDDTFLTDTTDNQYTDNTQLSISTVYEYSVVAISCAGNSTAGVNSIRLGEYDITSLTVSNNDTNGETLLDWALTETSLQPINLSYFIQFNYTHTQGDVIDPSPLLTDMFSLISDVTSYNITKDITPPTFTGEGEIDTEVYVCIRITEQCGQSYSGMIACSTITGVMMIGICVGLGCLLIICLLISTGVIASIIVYCVLKNKGKSYSTFNSKKKPKELQDQTYSQKKPKAKSNYADLDLEFPMSDNLKKPEPVPETLYTAVQSSSYRSNH